MHALVNLDLEGILELEDTREGYRRDLCVGTHTHIWFIIFYSIRSTFRQKSNDFLNKKVLLFSKQESSFVFLR